MNLENLFRPGVLIGRPIDKKIEAELREDIRQFARQLGEWVEVEVEDRVARISGRLFSVDDKHRLLAVASSHAGVRACLDGIFLLNRGLRDSGFRFAERWSDTSTINSGKGKIYDLSA